MIVDDVIANRELLARRFETHGYETAQAEGGVRALELITQQQFDLVLLDVMMPDLDGREVLRRIREVHTPSELPVIMVTARTQSADVVEAISLGANDYITKPVDFAVAWARVDVQIGRKRAEEDARASEERLRGAHKLEAVGQLAGGIAHDFNNLLLVIDGYTRLALGCAEDNAEVAGHLGEVLRATEAAESLIKKLSVFSRRELVAHKVIRLADALDETETLLRPLFGPAHPLVLHISPAAAELCVETDPGELGHALINLAVNARDAGRRGGIIQLILDQPPEAPGMAEIRVVDEGCGMDADTLARIFDPFFTTKQQGKGTGLGLAMVYGFAQQSGGSIAVASEVGQGSTFRLRLPSVESQPSAAMVPTEGPAAGDGETILVVEDDPRLLRLMCDTLERCGYKVLPAGDGLEALELEADHGDEIALLLSDVIMPLLGGFELGAILRRSRPDLSILFMSGYPTQGELKRVSVPESAAFLAKPFKPADLARAVRQALDDCCAKPVVHDAA